MMLIMKIVPGWDKGLKLIILITITSTCIEERARGQTVEIEGLDIELKHFLLQNVFLYSPNFMLSKHS